MKEYTVGQNEEGKRLDALLRTIMPLAQDSFIHKMLRKKNIKLNDSKASGSERIKCGDNIKIFLKDETFELFAPKKERDMSEIYLSAYHTLKNINVIYEDEDVIIMYKPSGILSQKADKNDVSINEWMIGYLLRVGEITSAGLKTFRPSVLNRLDRNTKGLIIGAKNLNASRVISSMIKERTLQKYYFTTVKGIIEEDMCLEGYLYKDFNSNKVTVFDTEPCGMETEFIKTVIKVVKKYDDRTDLEVELVTGKSHQIRAHLSSIGHPILGDPKYGDRDFNRKYNMNEQSLTAYKLVFPEDCEIDTLKNRTVMLDGYLEEQRP